MAACCIDHLVVTAPNLESGAGYVRNSLGVEPEIGGEHPHMGTHNLVVRLGDAAYLEVIAVNPKAPSPGRPRWFGLDLPGGSRGPRLAAWVARTSDVFASTAASGLVLGAIEEMSREGLRWLITIPADGSLQADGIAPMLIQWKTEIHPASNMRASECSLLHLTGYHPQAENIVSMLNQIDFEGPFSAVPIQAGVAPHLVAAIQTSSGVRELGAP